jgi:hypothetical protein
VRPVLPTKAVKRDLSKIEAKKQNTSGPHSGAADISGFGPKRAGLITLWAAGLSPGSSKAGLAVKILFYFILF